MIYNLNKINIIFKKSTKGRTTRCCVKELHNIKDPIMKMSDKGGSVLLRRCQCADKKYSDSLAIQIKYIFSSKFTTAYKNSRGKLCEISNPDTDLRDIFSPKPMFMHRSDSTQKARKIEY